MTKYTRRAEGESVNVLVDRPELDDGEIADGHEEGYWAGPFVYKADAWEDLRYTHEEVYINARHDLSKELPSYTVR